MKKLEKFRIATNSIAFKVFLYLLLTVSLTAGIFSVTAEVYLLQYNAYSQTYEEYMYDALREEANRHLMSICYAGAGDTWITLDEMKKAFDREAERYGIGYVIKRNGHRIWGNYNSEGGSLPYIYSVTLERDVWDGNTIYNPQEFKIECILYVDGNFPKNDTFRRIGRWAGWVYGERNSAIPTMCIGGFLGSIISFIWLMCNAGRRGKGEEVVPGPLTAIPLDLLAAVFGFAMICVLLFTDQFYMSGVPYFEMLILLAAVVVMLLLCTTFCRELALRIKIGKCWRNTIIYRLCLLARYILKKLFVLLKKFLAFWGIVIQGIPLILYATAAVVLVIFAEFVGLAHFRFNYEELMGCWLFEKIILTPVVLYCALAFKQLEKGSRDLAEGNLSRKLDTKNLVLDFKSHGENLNRIGDGMARAVEQRMKSERLKTELITNVSHDIKTPLTSVINYADLLAGVATTKGELDREKVEEYSEVLLRQSKRLKKLLDDLLEASKATTGSLEVSLMPCEIGVMLEQAAGEYEARFAEKELKMLIHQPDEAIRIMADGRHLWRVFDNLFNNIYKYAQEGSRVYLNVEKKGSRVEVVFRNMSKYELNVSAQELEERFVRGDKARNLEGNGLGLSIAKSLMGLQNGTMDIMTDGDLFKVTLGFEILHNGEDQE